VFDEPEVVPDVLEVPEVLLVLPEVPVVVPVVVVLVPVVSVLPVEPVDAVLVVFDELPDEEEPRRRILFPADLNSAGEKLSK
jgi:hypothetical protein